MNHPWLRPIVAACLLIAFASGARAAEKDWNFLVFISGVNNLDFFGAMNINQMEEVGSTDQLNILVQWGSLSRPGVDRLHVQKDGDTSLVTSPVVASLGPADMGDWRELVRFANWAHDHYPAKKTFLVVWNHGTGWHRPEGAGPKDIAWDDRTGNKITTEQLGRALREIRAHRGGDKLEIYGSDACLMGMIEVADEMSDSVGIYLGSQDLEPGEGWPYNTFLRAWSADLSRSPAEVAKLLSRHFLEAYSEGGIYPGADVTMSVLDLQELPGFRQAMADLASQLLALSDADKARARDAAARAQNFFYPDYRDVIDYLDQLKKAGLTLSSDGVVRARHARLVLANDQNLNSFTHGLSVWLPTFVSDYEVYRDRYLGLSFHLGTGWGGVARITAGGSQ